GISAPDVNLGVGSASHAQQTAQIMASFEPVLLEHRPDIVLVYGDVNSTVATALVCAKLGIRVAHVEAGLRSFDRSMPEEINRLITDQLADLLFTPSEDGDANLAKEGVSPERVHLVGNVMIDTLVRMLPNSDKLRPKDLPKRYVLMTMHRPSNVDDPEWLKCLLKTLGEISSDIEVLFPVHPRTRERIQKLNLNGTGKIHWMDPASYLLFLSLQKNATVVVTDSGGIQEETTFLGVPCLTMRENTERPITVTMGTNRLVGRDFGKLRAELRYVLDGKAKKGQVPPLWDGNAATRIADVLCNLN
ncbi:MAG TPA: UDP-N-acetylglucosamine 2-epimerase (non-hydrolyzing), partial [Terriglobales bacterium]|nr:UDP-N-acetylglucosamine 2-epimerase (non-hydrolyzing) [Terriglobales bacterium]